MSFLSKAFGGIGDFLFGEDPKLDTKTTSTLTPTQQELLNKFLIPYLKGTPLESVTGTPFKGARTAPLTVDEQLIQQLVSPLTESSNNTFSSLTDTLTSLLNPGVTDVSDVFKQTVANPLIDTFNEDVLPELGRRFASTDPFGSDKLNSLVSSADNLTDSLSRGLTQFTFDTDQAAKNRSIQAAQLLQAIPGLQTSALQGAGSIAALPRTIEQQGLDVEFQEFLRTQVAERDKRIQQILAALGFQTQETIGAGLDGSDGFINSFLGGGGKLSSLNPFG